MQRFAVSLVLAALALSACSRRVEVNSGGEVSTMSSTPVLTSAAILPSGVVMTVQTNQSLSTTGNKKGDPFTASVVSSVTTSSGSVIVPAGAVVTGHITALDDSSDPTDRALIQLRFDSLKFNGRSYAFDANITDVGTVEQRNRSTGKVVQRAATGAAAGAVIGAIVGGAELDAIIKGGLIGAAAGTVVSLGMGDVEHVIPAGTRLTIQSTRAVAIR